MDIKEIGITSVVLIGGAVVGVSQYGLSDVLDGDLRHVNEVPMEERQAYMDSVTKKFIETYDGSVHGTDTFNFSSPLIYENNAQKARFTEVVKAEQELSKTQVKELRTFYSGTWMCDHEDSQIFTNKGWTYRTTFSNKDGKHMVTVNCKPKNNVGLRVG